MNSKKLFSSIFLTLILASFLGVFAPASIGVNGAVVSPDSWFYALPYVVIEGYQPELSASMMTIEAVLDTVYNASVPAVGMVSDSFFEASIASEDYVTDGISRTFSSSMYTTLNFESAGGMYQTLQGIDESSFSQYAVDRDTTFYTYTTTDPFSETVTAELDDFDPDWTYLNFTTATMYMVLPLDKALVDSFFADALAKDGYDLIADEYSTNAQMITTLLDDVFTDHIFDIIYSPVNETLLDSGVTIAEDVRAVMGGNATDTSINGTTKIVSIRDALVGFTGQKLASEATIELDAMPVEGGSPFFRFEQTSTTYTIYFDVKSDYCTGDTLDNNFSGLFTVAQPGEQMTIFGASINLGWLLFISIGTALFVSVITYLIIKNNKDRVAISMFAGLVVGALAGLIYFIISYINTLSMT